MTTAIRLPRFATNANYSSGPDAGTPTKVDPAIPENGFVNGQAIAAQHVNFHIAQLATAARRALVSAALRLRPLDQGSGGPTSDTAGSLGACLLGTGNVLVAKGGTGGVYSFTQGIDLALQSGGSVADITTSLAALANSGSRIVAVGNGTKQNAFSTNNGSSWTAGGPMGLATPPTACLWYAAASVFAACNAGSSATSPTGATWTAAHSGFDIGDVLTGGSSGELAQDGSAYIYTVGTVSNVAFAKAILQSGDLDWTLTAGTIPSPSNYGNQGSIAGDGTALYWLGHPSAVSSTRLDLFVSTNGGASWTKRSEITGLTLSTPTPKLLVCPDTGLMVAVVAQTGGHAALACSFDKGTTWSEVLTSYFNSAAAFKLAGGRLWYTVGAKLFASDGIGSE